MKMAYTVNSKAYGCGLDDHRYTVEDESHCYT